MFELELNVLWVSDDSDDIVDSLIKNEANATPHTFYSIDNISPYDDNLTAVCSGGAEYIVVGSYKRIKDKIRKVKEAMIFKFN